MTKKTLKIDKISIDESLLMNLNVSANSVALTLIKTGCGLIHFSIDLHVRFSVSLLLNRLITTQLPVVVTITL